MPETMWISDGKFYAENDNPAQSMPDFSQTTFSPPVTFSDTIYTHPLDGMIGTPFTAMVFPNGLAQRPGFYNIVGEEILVETSSDHGMEPGGRGGDRSLLDRRSNRRDFTLAELQQTRRPGGKLGDVRHFHTDRSEIYQIKLFN